jgi:hypothetical protein
MHIIYTIYTHTHKYASKKTYTTHFHMNNSHIHKSQDNTTMLEQKYIPTNTTTHHTFLANKLNNHLFYIVN